MVVSKSFLRTSLCHGQPSSKKPLTKNLTVASGEKEDKQTLQLCRFLVGTILKMQCAIWSNAIPRFELCNVE
jgi:hypothetical protein